MTLTREQHKTIWTIIAYGDDNFSGQLGRALLNTDNGIPCIVELAKCLTPADSENRPRILGLLKEADLILDMPQIDRLQFIIDTFPSIWQRHADMAAAFTSQAEGV